MPVSPNAWFVRNLLLQVAISLLAGGLLLLAGIYAFAVAVLASALLLWWALRSASADITLVWRLSLLFFSVFSLGTAAMLAIIWEVRAECSSVGEAANCVSVVRSPLPYDNPRRPLITPAP